jgi:5-methylcytosine-specific restriction endonuclease McrA
VERTDVVRTYSLSHLSNGDLLRGLTSLVSQDRNTTAALLAHLAEVDARNLYLPAGYSSMHAYCVNQHRMSEDEAYKRLRVARTALRFPVLFAALAERRLTLTAVLMLTPHLTSGNAEELLSAAERKTNAEIEEVLARRFPRPGLLALLPDVPRPVPAEEPLAVRPVEEAAPVPDGCSGQLAARPVAGPAPVPDGWVAPLAVRPVAAPALRTKVVPISVESVDLHVTLRKSTYAKLRYAQELLSHEIAPSDVDGALARALDLAIATLEKRKFAATRRPRRNPPRTRSRRHIPAHVKRAVWERDGGRCTFTSETGQRCPARAMLEFDHVEPVARGGRATIEGIRLRCRAHNQYEAERVFGAGFMETKRQEARRAAEDRAQLARQRAEEAVRYSPKLGLMRRSREPSIGTPAASACSEPAPSGTLRPRSPIAPIAPLETR